MLALAQRTRNLQRTPPQGCYPDPTEVNFIVLCLSRVVESQTAATVLGPELELHLPILQKHGASVTPHEHFDGLLMVPPWVGDPPRSYRLGVEAVACQHVTALAVAAFTAYAALYPERHAIGPGAVRLGV